MWPKKHPASSRLRRLTGLDRIGVCELAPGGLDDGVDAAVVGNGLVELEGERGAGADDGGLGRGLHSGEGSGEVAHSFVINRMKILSLRHSQNNFHFLPRSAVSAALCHPQYA